MSRWNKASSEPRYELIEISQISSLARLLEEFQDAQLGTLSCGKQTPEQIQRCEEIIKELESMGYPYDEYAHELQGNQAETVARTIYAERARALGAFAFKRSDGI